MYSDNTSNRGSRGGGGRGRGRGRGGYNNNTNHHYNNNNNTNNNHTNNVPITSRLGPVGGKAFSSNSYNQGRNTRHRGNTEQFNNAFTSEDTDMNIEQEGGHVVVVSGYPPGAEEKILGFLKRKARGDWEALHIQNEHNGMQITVANQAMVDTLCRMNNYEFGKATLRIEGKESGYRPNSNRGNTNSNTRTSRPPAARSAFLAEFLEKRWNPQAGFLDMDDLPDTSHNISVVISKLLTEAKYLFGDSLITISFARNKLWSVSPLTKLADQFPNIQNLSIAENEIADFRKLDLLANRFPRLQELVLSGNPIQKNFSSDRYQKEVLSRFPTITFLDMQPVNEAPMAQTGTQELPVSVQPYFFDQDSSRSFAQDFLSTYFPLFDSNRVSLVDMYDAQAVFSSVFSKGNEHQNHAWGSSKMTPGQRMVVGNQNIIQRIQQLPQTVHDLSRPDKFVIDAWQTSYSETYPVVLFLTVHAEFAELPLGTPLQFDRNFILIPSNPGSRAHAAGWQYMILSDSLLIRTNKRY
ncbi:mRNA export factor mex67 [Choanephora cucurbitarum]|uniref:mRNA export factor mex67 n=1 Tax=Choanephora cucurbitarum TaxID=101091 RepID=A0A1C7NG83_9FUNG|nr:mRNA export factor mex67 [Choanephora cucurbitarum]